MLKNKKLILSILSTITILGTASLSVSAQALTNRLYGQNRIDTSVAVATAGWPTSDYAIVADAWDFPDAVSAAPLAYKYKAPILLTDTKSLTKETSDELSSLQVKHAFIVGGTGVISPKVASQIEAKGIDVQRLCGDDRYGTSVAIANQVGTSGSVVITNGYNPYEALSISPIAAKEGMPIILTARKTVPDAVANYIKQNNVTKTYVLGNADGVTDDDGVANNSIFPNPVRITGANLYERNVNIIKMFSSDLNFSKIYLASGKGFADALSGSALAATTSSPVIFVNANIAQATKDFITSIGNSVTNINILGGTGSISNATVQNVETLLSTSGGSSNTTTPSPLVVQSVSAVNGTVTVTLSGPPTTAPAISDFAVTQSIGGGAATTVAPTNISTNGNVVTLTVPVITTSSAQSVIDSVSFLGATVSASPFTVNPADSNTNTLTGTFTSAFGQAYATATIPSGATVTSVTSDGTLVASTNYSLSGTTLTILNVTSSNVVKVTTGEGTVYTIVQ
ncbi:cell wall-binding repeat-containing protein [Clostridium sp. WILCCON 0269]|uniref:Cell wall-binding repeat-containing protein n=1 Tax=Candidatus Clostridium eludens TaxID=3381663 RepID=A0ABW8SQ32_9CLOT